MSSTQKKKSLFSRIMKWSGISVLVLILLIMIAPFLFKDKIVAIVKEEANKNLNAKVDFGDFDLTLFTTFPDFRFKIQNVSVINVEPFKGDTLAYIKELSFDLNLMSVISGSQYKVNSLIINEPKINGIVMHDGKANWDITKPSTDTTTTQPTSDEPTKFALKLKALEIAHANIKYDDMQGNMLAIIKDMNYTMSGDFTQDVFTMKNLLEIAELTYKMDGIGYLTKAKTRFKADLDMDMPKMKFTFKENEFGLNDLLLAFDGFVEMPKEDITMDLKFGTKQTEFKSILSLIPSVYSKDFANVKTAGKLKLDGFAKGTLHSEKDSTKNTYPSFDLKLLIADAMFKYPSLPKSVNNINIDVHVANEKNYLDATTIDVNKFHIEMAGNPVDFWAHVKTPISDPAVDANVKGTINLSSVKEFIPLEKGDEMSGIIKADISAAGRMSSLDKKEYDKFKMGGSLEIDKMNYKTTSLPYDVLLNTMKMNFTNQYVELAAFDALMGKSDVKANGKIENFMQYVFKDSLIKGAFNVQSNLMDLNQLMASDASTTTTQATTTTADTAAMSVIEVPGNIDFTLNAQLNKVLYDNLTIDNMLGNIVIRNKKVDMTNLKLGLLGGNVLMNGYYETTNPKKPSVDLTFKVDNFDIQKTFNAFNTVQKLAPIGQYAKGMFTATLENFRAELDHTMSPILSTLKGNGVFKTNSVSVGGFPAFVKLGEALKIEQLKNMTIQNVVADYEFKDGRVALRNPVKVKIDKISADITGSTGFDQTIDYNWKMDVPTEIFGSQANTVAAGLLGQANAALGSNVALPKNIKVNVGFGGTVTNPTIKTGTKAGEDGPTLKDQVISNVKDKANEEAQKILADAQAQVAKMKADAQAAADKLKAEAYAEADRQVEQVSNPLAKVAAKKAAEVAKKEADKKAQKILDDAEAKSQKTLEDAKARSAAAAGK